MSLGIRSFVEFLIDEIKKEGVLSSGYHSSEEIESDIIDQIWNAYENYKINK